MKKPEQRQITVLTLDEARKKVLNYLSNSTSCCFKSAPNPACAYHTAAWIEDEAQERVKDSVRQAEFHRTHTTKLGEIVPRMTARKVGEQLVKLGLRIYDDKSESYRASQAALDEGYALLVNEYGFPKVYWVIEPTMTAILEGVDNATLSRWQEINSHREDYEHELERLDKIIDHAAYMTRSERETVYMFEHSGEFQNILTQIHRRAVRRAYYDERAGKPVVLLNMKTQP